MATGYETEKDLEWQRRNRKQRFGTSTLSHDAVASRPRIADTIYGLIRDPDGVLAKDPDGYRTIYQDDQIATSLRKLTLKVANCDWKLTGEEPDTQALAAAARSLCVGLPGWDTMVRQACYAMAEGVRIIRVLWEPCTINGHPAMRPAKFVARDKRKYRPEDAEWKKIWFCDDFQSATLTNRPPEQEEPRDYYIIPVWQDDEERLGFGDGVGERLYKVAVIRRELLKLFWEAMETTIGGIRVLTFDFNVWQNLPASEQTALREAAVDAINNAISFDTVDLPPGTTFQIHFPSAEALEAFRASLKQYLDEMPQKLLLGTVMSEGSSEKGSLGFGLYLDHESRLQVQAIVDWLAESFTRDLLGQIFLYNPWLYEVAAVSRGTPLPRYVGTVRGGADHTAGMGLAQQHRGHMLKTQYEELTGITIPSEEQISNRETIEIAAPAAPAPATGGGFGSGGLSGGAGGSFGAQPPPVPKAAAPGISRTGRAAGLTRNAPWWAGLSADERTRYALTG